MTDYSALPAREIDALVAREVMGWTEVPDGYGGTSLADRLGHLTGFFTPSSLGARCNRFRPSTNGDHMLAVLDALRGRGWTPAMRWDDGAWIAIFWPGEDHETAGSASAATLPRAVAEAALAAVGGK